MPVFLVAVALVAVGASWAASSARAAGGNVVSFGYADSERANATQFPTPWAGDPGVIFEGCTPASSPTGKCVFDSSAVKVTNNTGSDETVNSLVVVFPGSLAGNQDCVVDIWPHDVTLPAGQTLVATQTTASPTDTGCDQPVGTLDGSEVGPNGQNWGGLTHCATNSGIIPKVILTVNNSPTTVTDTSQVLNTGGTDAANCQNGVPRPVNKPQYNESEAWGCVNGSQTLTLTPPTQTHFVGQQATVTATLDNTCGAPIQGANVAFDDTAGPDVNLTGSGITDANGQATFTYTGNTVGTDTWDSDVVNPGGTLTSNNVNVIWQAPPLTGNTFVIGDQNAALNTNVEFWGAQWWKLNSLSGGTAPAAFKGFALNVTGNPPSCGDTWTTAPGNSPPPPVGPLPALIPIIVSSNITKSGNTISGDIKHIVIVQTNPGYSNDPGHAGTGTVVSQVC